MPRIKARNGRNVARGVAHRPPAIHLPEDRMPLVFELDQHGVHGPHDQKVDLPTPADDKVRDDEHVEPSEIGAQGT